MRRRLQWIIAIAILASSVGHAQWATPRGEVSFPDGTRVTVEIADTPALRARGLMFRDKLPENEGMIFLFEQTGFYPFWMQNCLIAIDMIWVDDQKRVVSVAHSVPPCRMEGCAPPCNAGSCPNDSPTGDALTSSKWRREWRRSISSSPATGSTSRTSALPRPQQMR